MTEAAACGLSFFELILTGPAAKASRTPYALPRTSGHFFDDSRRVWSCCVLDSEGKLSIGIALVRRVYLPLKIYLLSLVV